MHGSECGEVTILGTDSRFVTSETALAGLLRIERKPMGDSRGYLERLFCADELRGWVGDQQIVQINHTLTANRATVRGLHFQYPPHAEIKFVQCLRGEVFDVAVDLRRDSATFLRWHGEILSGSNFRSLMIPVGFAHGFQTLTNDCEMLYFHTQVYSPSAEDGVRVDDPCLAIAWPLPVSGLSVRDAGHPYLGDKFQGIVI